MIIKKRHLKHLIYLLLGAAVSTIVLFIWGNLYFDKLNPISPDLKIGVTYSADYAKNLGLDWQKTYLDILDNLGVRYIRLETPWRDIEPKANQFDFSTTDYLVNQAKARNAHILVVLGIKQPRWPECKAPAWAENLTVTQRRQEVLKIITKVVERYKNNPNIWGWQVENEPLFDFGLGCDIPDRVFLKQEVDLVRSLDSSRSIVLTDSGELRPWVTPMQLSDIFGTTLYRTTYNQIFGYFYYPLPPSFYYFKSNLIRHFFAPNNKKTIVIELQAEPWSPTAQISQTPISDQLKVFNLSALKNNVSFAKRTGFDEIYLWGAEWWYYMANHGHSEFLDYAKTIFHQY